MHIYVGGKSFSLSFPYLILAFKGGKSMVVINIDTLKWKTLYNEMSSTKLTFRQQIKRTMVFYVSIMIKNYCNVIETNMY